MFIELHILQNFPISCLNRDDTNTPKTCEFGGYRRSRISSQCIKRAIRWNPEFRRIIDNDLFDIRTKRLKKAVKDELSSQGDIYDGMIEIYIELFWSALQDDKGEKTKVLLYLGQDEIKAIAEQLKERYNETNEICNRLTALNGDKKNNKEKINKLKKDLKKIWEEPKYDSLSPGIALFGRMVAEVPKAHVDAACQVAHAISTNKIDMEMDFYTAMDDLLEKDTEIGADMMGTIECNSSCYYRYSLVDFEQLKENLNENDKTEPGLSKRTLEAFIRASIAAVPTGKITSFANNNRPDFLFIVVRDTGMPANLANAFAFPVIPDEFSKKSLIERSIEEIDKYWGKILSVYGSDGISKMVYSLIPGNCKIENIKEKKENIEELIESVISVVN